MQHHGLRNALRACRDSFAYAAFFSLFVNLLLLVPAIYMLQVYDRVLGSGSVSTLVMLTLLTVFLFALMGGLEWVRSQILIATSNRLDGLLAPRVFDAVFRQAQTTSGKVASAQPLSDLMQLRQFLTGQGLFAFFDAPWLPIYIAVMFLFHPLIGVVAIASALALIGLALANELAVRADLNEASGHAIDASQQTQRHLRNVDAIEAMGMLPRLRARWLDRQQAVLALQSRASRRGGLITAASKTFRQLIQTLILGLGAYLAIRREISAGGVIAGSILLGRALAPLDQMIGAWRGFVSARESYGRLGQLLAASATTEPPLPLPAPQGLLTLDKVVYTPSGADAPVLRGISLEVPPGCVLAVIGPSAAGKTTLLRAMLGLVDPTSGDVRLDGAKIDQWEREALGQHIGYLPQDVELLDGTIAENIARFGQADAAKVIAAADAAGVRSMILRLPQGYGTRVAGHVLSAGQRQRIGLARALYGMPQWLLLDEPNANLDQEGEAALAATLQMLKRAGRSVVVVTHRKDILALADRIAVLAQGQLAMHGPRDEVLARLARAADAQPGTAPRRPLAVAVPLHAAAFSPAAGDAKQASA
jgi:ATP-binding cassette, subfamily C, bacterial EexD